MFRSPALSASFAESGVYMLIPQCVKGSGLYYRWFRYSSNEETSNIVTESCPQNCPQEIPDLTERSAARKSAQSEISVIVRIPETEE